MYKTIIFGIAALFFAGCFSVKTEHDIKPINITMDINLKVDGTINEAISEVDHAAIRTMLDEGKIGFNKKSLLEARTTLNNDEMEEVVKNNANIKKRIEKVAASKNLTTEEFLEQNHDKFVSHIRTGVWYELSDGTWTTKK